MKLLKLAPDIQETILGLPLGTPKRLVTERKLRQVVALGSGTDQKLAFEKVLGEACSGKSGLKKKAG